MGEATEKQRKRSHDDEQQEPVVDDVVDDVDVVDDNNDNDDVDDNNDTDKPKRKRKRKRKNKENEGGESKPEHDSTEAKLSSLHHTVYVEGIPFDCSEEEVKEFFVSNGCDGIIQLRLPRWQDSGRLRGYGHVVFRTTEARELAIQDLNGNNMGKRYLTIQAPKEPKPDTTMGASQGNRETREQPSGCNIVFVKNLPYQATEDDLMESFQVCGKIVQGGVRIARNYQTRQSKGFAYIEYKNPEGAHGAVQKAAKAFGMTVLGRPCFVDYEEGAMKGSYKTQEGKLWTKEYPGKKEPPQRSR